MLFILRSTTYILIFFMKMVFELVIFFIKFE